MSTYHLDSNPEREFENPFDLNNLRYLDKKVVMHAFEKIESFRNTSKPFFCLIATGGTIASTMQEGSLVPTLDIDYLLSFTGRDLERNYNHASMSFPKLIDSSQMTMDYDADIVIAISWLHKKMSEETKKHFYGFVITHGTDTMSQSSTRITMMLGSNLDFSVGIVGAQTTIDDPFSDVPDNFARCLAVLSLLKQKEKNTVFVYMGGSSGGAYHPSGVLKISDTKVKGFDSQVIPPIVDASDFRKTNHLHVPFFEHYQLVRQNTIDFFQPLILRGFTNTRIIEAQMDISPSELKSYIEYSEALAFILITYGSFSFNKEQIDGIVAAASTKGSLLFGRNPFPTGHSDHLYPEAKYLIHQGIIPLSMLPHAAIVKLSYASALYGSNKHNIKNFMVNNNFIGEQPNHWRSQNKHETMREFGQPRESLPQVPLKVYP